MPIPQETTPLQYVDRLHRLPDGKRIVQVYDYADIRESMLARMDECCLKGYAAIEYELASMRDETD